MDGRLLGGSCIGDLERETRTPDRLRDRERARLKDEAIAPKKLSSTGDATGLEAP